MVVEGGVLCADLPEAGACEAPPFPETGPGGRGRGGEGEGFPPLRAEGLSDDGLQRPLCGQGLVRPRDDDLF